MCGIAGLITSHRSQLARPAAEIAHHMAECVTHRGPDDAGVWESEDGTVALSHRRLSIVDLSPLGRNPMSWGDGRLWITFNGEIYNFGELRTELRAAGHQFRSRTDTEVILAAYDQWGLDAVHRFVGMFAFAIWDEPRRRLWVVRDRVGKKPLYYVDANGTLSFASELKSLVSAGVTAGVDPEAVRLYLRFGYVPSPYTIYQGVSKLPPAHHLIYESGRTTVRRYWDPLDHALEVPRHAADAEAELESRLKTAVQQRMIADVPVGAFLSGGIDSSLVAALMTEQNPGTTRTFTIRFENPAFNEADHAAAVARHLGCEHHEQTCGEKEMLDVVGRLPDMFDEPFADSSAVPTYLVSRVARQMVTVSLSGDGGDELFFGYTRYQLHTALAAISALPLPVRRLAAMGMSRMSTPKARRLAELLRTPAPDAYGALVAWVSAGEVALLTGRPPIEAPLYADVLRRTRALKTDSVPGLLDLVSYLPEDILTKVDRASMAVSLEVRAPLLDHRVIEFALGVPLALKRRKLTMKWLLRRLLYKRVPQSLLDRPKMGFGVPLADWLRGPLAEQMNDYVSGPDLEDLGIRPELIRETWAGFKAGTIHRPALLWQIFTLVAWSRRWGSPAVRGVRAPLADPRTRG